MAEPTIEVNSLSYNFQDGSIGLKDVSLGLPAGSRTLLIGGNIHTSPLIGPLAHLEIGLNYISTRVSFFTIKDLALTWWIY